MSAPWLAFRKKPVVIRAYQFTQAMIEATVFDGAPLPDGVCLAGADYHPGRREITYSKFFVRTMHGDKATVIAGDWIVPEPVADRFYPVNAEVFANTYDALAEPASPAQSEGV